MLMWTYMGLQLPPDNVSVAKPWPLQCKFLCLRGKIHVNSKFWKVCRLGSIVQLRIYLDMVALTWNDDARAILAYVACCSERNRAQDRTLPIFTRARQKRAAKAQWAIAICQGFSRATQTTF